MKLRLWVADQTAHGLPPIVERDGQKVTPVTATVGFDAQPPWPPTDDVEHPTRAGALLIELDLPDA